MKCPFCGAEDTQVKDSRQSQDFKSIKRRRFCSQCNSRFSTLERLELKELTVIKRDGSKRPFDRQKIINSIELALRKRSFSNEQIEQLVDNLMKEIEEAGGNEISTKVLGEMILEELAKLDDVAYVRFASVYHDFAAIGDFKEFLSKIAKKSN